VGERGDLVFDVGYADYYWGVVWGGHCAVELKRLC
jgi:hypothetical protein